MVMHHCMSVWMFAVMHQYSCDRLMYEVCVRHMCFDGKQIPASMMLDHESLIWPVSLSFPLCVCGIFPVFHLLKIAVGRDFMLSVSLWVQFVPFLSRLSLSCLSLPLSSLYVFGIQLLIISSSGSCMRRTGAESSSLCEKNIRSGAETRYPENRENDFPLILLSVCLFSAIWLQVVLVTADGSGRRSQYSVWIWVAFSVDSRIICLWSRREWVAYSVKGIPCCLSSHAYTDSERRGVLLKCISLCRTRKV